MEGEQTVVIPSGEIDTPAYIFPPVDLLEKGDEENAKTPPKQIGKLNEGEDGEIRRRQSSISI